MICLRGRRCARPFPRAKDRVRENPPGHLPREGKTRNQCSTEYKGKESFEHDGEARRYFRSQTACPVPRSRFGRRTRGLSIGSRQKPPEKRYPHAIGICEAIAAGSPQNPVWVLPNLSAQRIRLKQFLAPDGPQAIGSRRPPAQEF